MMSPINENLMSARKWSQLVFLIPMYILQLSYGMHSGFPAILTPQLRDKNCDRFIIDDNEESWIVSIDNLTTPIVCLISGTFQITFGPKKVLIFACLPYIAAWCFSYFATSVWWFYVSRLLVGVSHALIITTVYTVEVASRDLRGTLSQLEAVLRCLGCLVTYALGYFLHWSTITLIALGPPTLAVFTLFLVSESPIYLLKKDQIQIAEKTCKQLYGPNFDVTTHISEAKLNLESFKNKKSASIYETFKRPEIYKPFLIIVGLSIVMQFTGMAVLRSYVVKIFNGIFNEDNSTSIQSNSSKVQQNCDDKKVADEAYFAALMIGAMRLIASLLSSKLLYHYRRRTMYFFSAILTIISVLIFATCNYFLSNTNGILSNYWNNIVQWISLISAGSLVFSVQLGVQTLPLLLSGELFPSDVRPICKGIARCIQCVLLVICLKLYPILANSKIGVYGAFYFFGGIVTLALPVVYFVLPETKDLSLEIIQNYFTPVKTVFYVDINEN